MHKHLVLTQFLARGIIAVAFLACPAVSLSSSFEDSFDDEPGSGDGASGQSGLNYASFANWNVSLGTVDLIAQGDFGVSCANETGKCVDLDGSTGDAGVLVSLRQMLVPGSYAFSFELAGVSDSFNAPGAAEPNLVDVSVGDFYSDQILREQGDPYETFGGEFLVTEPTEVFIVFSNQGGDFFGAMLDNVKLSVPEPGTFALLGSAGLWLLMAATRKRRVDCCKRT